jgi:hypothetical protein
MSSHSLKRFIPIVVLAALALGMFTQVMRAPLIRDEHMFVAAGVLLQTRALYRDFAYLQTPYLPALYALVYVLTGTAHFLLWGRLLTLIAVFLSTLLVYVVCHRLSQSLFIALACLLLFALNQTMLVTMTSAWNHALPIAFSLLAFYLLVTSISETSIHSLGLILGGVFVGAAIGAKLTFVFYLLPLLALGLLYPRSVGVKARVAKVLLPAFGGVLLGSLPILVFLARTDLDTFWFNNLGYHHVNTAWRAATDYPVAMSLVSKIKYVRQLLAHPSNLALCLAVSFSLLSLLAHVRRRTLSFRQLTRLELVFSFLLALAAIVVAFQPTPLWPMYFTMPLTFLVILISCCYAITPGPYTLPVRTLLLCLILATLFFAGPQLFKGLPGLPDIRRWTPIAVHATARQLGRHIDSTHDQPKVATLSPVYALEAGLPIYPELSTGAFLYRVGDLIPEKKRAGYVGASPTGLHALLDRDPPTAIFVGFEGDLDASFVSYAEERGCSKVEEDLGGGTLYLCLPE